MEIALNWEYKELVDELTQGMEKAMQLRFHLSLSSMSASEAHDLLLQRIISTFENALLILKWGECGSVGRAQASGAPTLPAAPESSISAEDDASPKSKKFRDRRDNVDDATNKKRKLQATWTEQVRVSCENGVEGTRRDDKYSWRKYGQKHILGAKHPRSYYRCTYRHVRNCWATKQVQQRSDDQTLFDITYKGNHTCNRSSNAVSPPQEQEMETLLDFKAKNQQQLRVDDTEEGMNILFPSTSSCTERENQYSPISASALGDEYHMIMGTNSPVFYTLAATSESNYFSAATNSPNGGGMEITIDDLDPNFLFNIPGFFT